MYQWTAKTLGKQAAKTLGKKVLDEAGDIAIGAALKELGLLSDPTAEMKKALAEMNGKLDMLLTEVSQVTKNIESLRSELKFSTAELKNVVEAVGIRLARDSIQRAYSGGIKSSASRPTVQSEQVSAAFVSPITSLAEAVRRRMAGETIPKGAIDEFC